jgi:hypothetical protein
MQLHCCRWRSKARGNLAEEKKLLSLPGVRLEVVWVVSLKLMAASVEELVLLLPILEKEENKNGSLDWLLPPWRKKKELSAERDKCGGEGGRRAGGSVAWSH